MEKNRSSRFGLIELLLIFSAYLLPSSTFAGGVYYQVGFNSKFHYSDDVSSLLYAISAYQCQIFMPNAPSTVGSLTVFPVNYPIFPLGKYPEGSYPGRYVGNCANGNYIQGGAEALACWGNEDYDNNLQACTDPEDNPDKEGGCPGENTAGNPCNVASGNKYQSETDFSGSLSFVRSYNSSNLVDLNLGKGWSSAYQKRLIVSTNYLTLVNGAGRGEPWRKINSVWVGDADSDFIVTENTAGYTIDKQNGDTEEYDSEGQMMSETDSQGRQTTFAYDANSRLIQVTDHFGLNLDLAYDTNGHLESVTDANNATYQYEYDVNDNLIGVVYPDLTPADDSDNAKRVYHYENSNFPNHLTGVTDENGDRFAIYAYDENGKAILTEHAQTTGAVGQEQFQLDFQGQ